MAKYYERITAEGIIDVYGATFLISPSKFLVSLTSAYLSTRKSMKSQSHHEKYFTIKKVFPYHFGVGMTARDSSTSAMHYKQTSDLLRQETEHDAEKEKDEKFVKKNWTEDIQLLSKFKDHEQALLDLLKELENMCDGYLASINVAKIGLT